jgi:hypothetical protein
MSAGPNAAVVDVTTLSKIGTSVRSCAMSAVAPLPWLILSSAPPMSPIRPAIWRIGRGRSEVGGDLVLAARALRPRPELLGELLELAEQIPAQRGGGLADVVQAPARLTKMCPSVERPAVVCLRNPASFPTPVLR